MAAAPVKEEVALTLDTQGDTGTASRLKILAKISGVAVAAPFGVRVRVCNDGTYADSTNATIAAQAGYSTLIGTHTATKDLDLLSIDSNSAGVLTIAGVVVDGETVTLGTRVYEFDTDDTITPGRVAVDVGTGPIAAAGTLTIGEQVTAMDVMIVGNRAYVFVALGTADKIGEIDIGANEAAVKVNIVAAINGTDGVNVAHDTVTAAAFSGDDCVITATKVGTSGNAIATTENFTDVANVFDAATLGTTTAGTDPLAAAAVTALALAITNDTSAVVTGVDGTGDTVDVVAKVAGAVSDAIVTTETMANGSFAAATLLLGSIPSELFFELTDATVETVEVRMGQAEIEGINAALVATSLDVAHAAP